MWWRAGHVFLNIALFKMAAPREHQIALPLPATWGGRRAGAGRPPIPGRRRPMPHRSRPVHRAAHPVHVTLRTCAGLRSLRTRGVFPAVRAAIAVGSRAAFRIVHFSVQSDHVHLVCEAADAAALSRGTNGLSVRIARAVNRALGRSGRVFGDRYHARDLGSPREVRHGLVYVLMNFRKHLPRARAGLDDCSSAAWFDGFIARIPGAKREIRRNQPPVAPARTWLATVGWRRHGLIDPGEAPRPARTRQIRSAARSDG